MAKQLLLSLLLSTVCNSVRKPRNIIVLLGDDIGWNEVSGTESTAIYLLTTTFSNFTIFKGVMAQSNLPHT